MLGQLVAPLPSETLAPLALSNEGLPLLLSPYEVYLGYREGWIDIVTKEMHIDETKSAPGSTSHKSTVLIPTECSNDIYLKSSSADADHIWTSFFGDPILGSKRKLVQEVFDHLWRRGYYVQVSSHYYTDLVVYEHDPLLIHAKYLVVCAAWNQKMKMKDLMSLARLSNSVKKALLLASSRPQDNSSTDLSNSLASLSLEPNQSAPGEPTITFVEFSWQGVS